MISNSLETLTSIYTTWVNLPLSPLNNYKTDTSSLIWLILKINKKYYSTFNSLMVLFTPFPLKESTT